MISPDYPLLMVLAAAVLLGACLPGREPSGSESDAPAATPSVEPREIDREPNDRPDQAVELDVGVGRGSVRDRDVDVFSLRALPAVCRLSVESDPPNGVRVDVVSSDEPVPPPGSARMRLEALRGGEGLLVVRSVAAGDVDYTLDAEPLELPDLGILLAEPNDAAHPEPIDRLPARAAGFYDGPGDRDAVVIRTDVLRRYGATTVEVSPIAGMRPVVRLLDADTGEELATWRAARAGEGTGVPNLGGLEGVEQVVIEISEAEGGLSSQPYTLSLHRPEPRAGDLLELEPDDRPDQAGLVDAPATVAGTFHSDDDVDLFRVRVSQPGVVSVAVRPDPWTDAAITWHAGAADALVQDIAGVGAAEQLCARPAGEGIHLVEVAARSGTMQRLSTYELDVSVETGRFEREPNDDPMAEDLQPFDREIRGFMESPSDRDVYALRLFPSIDAGVDQRIELIPPPGVDVALEVLDDEGLTVAPRVDESGPGRPEEVRVPRSVTTYRVVVSGGRQGGVSCEDAYRLILSSE